MWYRRTKLTGPTKSGLTAREDTPMNKVAKRGRHARMPSRKEHVMRHENHIASIAPPVTCAVRGASWTNSRNGFLNVALVVAVATFLLPPTIAPPAAAHAKRHPGRPCHAYP